MVERQVRNVLLDLAVLDRAVAHQPDHSHCALALPAASARFPTHSCVSSILCGFLLILKSQVSIKFQTRVGYDLVSQLARAPLCTTMAPPPPTRAACNTTTFKGPQTILTRIGVLRFNKTKVIHTFWSSFVSVRLHGDMRVQVIERAICLLTTLPTTLVHSFDFFISTAGALVLLGTGNGNEGIDLLEARQIHGTRE
jgi:hypothetical protein